MFATILSLAFIAQAQPQEVWETLAAEGDSGAYYEPASVRGEGGDRVSVRMRIDVGAPGTEGAVRTFSRHLFDCGDRTIGFLSVHSYDAQGGLIVSREVNVAEAELERIEPDSVEAALYDRVCRGR